MVTVTATLPPPPPPPPQQSQALKLDSLVHIDMRTLSQSELHALSCSSPSAFNLAEDVVVPTIDRSLFNESAGSRRQTFSRLRESKSADAATGHHHRRRVAGLLPLPKLPPIPADDPERIENSTIINYLKQYITENPKFGPDDLIPPPLPPKEELGNEKTVTFGAERKRKRGRKPKESAHLGENDESLEIVNKNGVVVDVSALAGAEDPYGEELRRRTVGLESEEALLGFMRDLGGQWGSRRKKRKIVDASQLGDALPIGWKLLLGLKRREGRTWVYCRRYISPNGLQFISCKEAASYLQSYFGLDNACQTVDPRADIIPQDKIVASESHAGVTCKDDDRRLDMICSSSLNDEHERAVTLFGIDNLAEVQIQDLFECHKCSMTFDEKDTYLQHLLSYHQRTTRRYRLGSSVGDGVIVKDGKYECQFCHKVFEERRRYNGHVGIHVRNYVRKVEESPSQTTLQNKIESPTRDALPSRISKMDALIEIAQISILETSIGGQDDEPKVCSPPDKLNVIPTAENPTAYSDHEMKFDSPLSDIVMDGRLIDRTVVQDLDQQDGEYMTIDEKIKMIDGAENVIDVRMDSCSDVRSALSANEQNGDASIPIGGKDTLAFSADDTEKSGIEQERGSDTLLFSPSDNQKTNDGENNMSMVWTSTFELSKPVEVDDNKNIELEIGSGERHNEPANNAVTGTVQKTAEENVPQCRIPDSSMSLVQPLHCFTTFNRDPNKEENEFGSIDQRHGNVTGFEELRLDEIEPLKFSFVTGQGSVSLSEVPIDLANNAEIEGTYGSSIQFESEEVMLNMAGRHQLTTVCVWCGIEFNHGAIDSEIQSDSVGFMCPTCKAKISGQLNVLDSGLPGNSLGL